MFTEINIQVGGFSAEYLKNRVYNRLHPGDIVRIPRDLNDGRSCMARVERIYPHFVLFRTADKVAITALYIEAAFLHVIEPSDYQLYDEVRDILRAFSEL